MKDSISLGLGFATSAGTMSSIIESSHSRFSLKSPFQKLAILGAISLISALLSACGSDKNHSEYQGDVIVRVPWWLSDLDLGLGDPLVVNVSPQKGSQDKSLSSQPRFENIKLHGISNLQKVSGDFAQFLIYPQVNGQEIQGLAPEAKFVRNEKGVFFPLNFLSAQMFSLYAHFERLLKLDEKLSVHPQLGTRTVLITSLEDSSSVVDNAFYKADIDSLIFIPYSQENVPLSVNPGVIAHEHFHAQFHRRFYLPLVQRKVLPPALMKASQTEAAKKEMGINQDKDTDIAFQKLSSREQDYFRVFIQGLNEGLADIWGWVYTGRSNFLALSLPQVGTSRDVKPRLQAQASTLPFKTKCSVFRDLVQIEASSKSSSQQNQFVLGSAYSLGTEFARMFYLAAQVSREDRKASYVQSRVDLARRIYEFLPVLAYGIEKSLFKINPLDVFAIYAQEIKDLSEKECDFWKRLLNTSMNDTDAGFVCRSVLTSSNSALDSAVFELRSVGGAKVFSARHREVPCR